MEQERGRQDQHKATQLCTDHPGGATHVHHSELCGTSLLNYTLGLGVGDEVREVPGSLVGHPEDLAFPLSKTGSHCLGF